MTIPKWLKTTLVIIFILFCLMDIWYLYLLKYAPNKSVLTTFNISTLDKVEGNDNYIIELNYYANEDKKGVELMEFKLKYLTNENTTDTMEVGIQLVGNSETPISSFLGKYKHTWDTTSIVVASVVGGPIGLILGASIGGANYYAADFNNCNIYKYNKYAGLSYKATSEINENSAFLITMDEDSFLMSFKGEQTAEQMVDENGNEIKNAFARYDVNYMLMKLFEAVSNSTLTNGTYYTKFEFKEDMFNFQKGKGNNTFDSIITDKTEWSKIEERVMNYFTIKINAYQRGAVISSDSLFGIIENQSNFNLTNNTDISNYHSKQQVIVLDEYDFEYVLYDSFSTATRLYNLQLSEKAKKELSKYSNYLLDIELDSDNLISNNIAINSFIQDEIFNQKTIYRMRSRYINEAGEIVYKEVETLGDSIFI